MRIHVSEATAILLKDKDFILMERGQVEVKASVSDCVCSCLSLNVLHNL